MVQEPAHLAELKMALGDRLGSARKAAGVTQQHLARRSGYSRSSVSHAQAGRQLLDPAFWQVADDMFELDGELVLRYREVVAAIGEHDEAHAAALRSTGRAANDNMIAEVAASQQAWCATRQHLIRHRTQLAELAGRLYEPSWRLPETPMLSSDAWLPETPISLEKVRLEWEPEAPKPIIFGQESQIRSTLPLRAPGQTFPSYSSAIRYLSRPNLFENRPSYRLLDASLNAGSGGLLRFGQASYFDKIDVSEALGHELASAAMRASVSWSNLPFRSLMADPYDLAVRTVNASITTLTVRVDANTGTATFFLLRRDPAKVVTGGGEYGVVPAGEFQPASISPDSLLADLDLWRNIVREYSEEFLGQPEHDGSSGRPLDYESWPFYRAMQRARLAGQVRAYVLGIAFNALSLNATIITATIIDSVAFDGLFRGMTSVNAEGEIVAGMGNNTSAHGIPFDQETVNHFLHGEPLLSPQAAASLSLMWRHRKSLSHGRYA